MSKTEERPAPGVTLRLDDIFGGLGYSEGDRQRFTASLIAEVNRGIPVPVRPPGLPAQPSGPTAQLPQAEKK